MDRRKVIQAFFPVALPHSFSVVTIVIHEIITFGIAFFGKIR